MGHEREILALMLEDHVFPLDWASEFSPEICVTAASDQVAPDPPTGLAVTGKLEGIEVGWTNPTTNADGTTCTDLWYVQVYYASKATHDAQGSIDPDNSDTYDGNPKFATEEWTHPVSAGAQFYYVVTAIDNTGNESVASSEVTATALTVGDSTNIPDDATGLILDAVAIGDSILVVVTHVPTTTWVGFSHYRLWYSVKNGSWGSWVEIGEIDNYGYTHKNLDTTKVYKYKATVIGEDGTESSTADTLDNSGAGYQPNAADNSSIGAILIAAQTIVGLKEVRAPNITCDNLAAINADLGAITAGSMDAARITTGTLVVARTQAKCTDALADQTSAHNCANPGDYTATIINGGLVTTGTLSLNDGSVTKAGITAVGAGDTNVRIWAGATYAARATAPFRVTQAGKCYATDFYTLTDDAGNAVISSGQFKGMTLLGTDSDTNTGTVLDLDISSLPASTYQKYFVVYEVANEVDGWMHIYGRVNGLVAGNYCWRNLQGAADNNSRWIIGYMDNLSCGMGNMELSTQYSVTRVNAARWPSFFGSFGCRGWEGMTSGVYRADVASVTRLQIYTTSNATGWIAVYGVSYA